MKISLSRNFEWHLRRNIYYCYVLYLYITFPSLLLSSLHWLLFNKRKKLFYPPEKFKIDNFACKSGRLWGGREGMGWIKGLNRQGEERRDKNKYIEHSSNAGNHLSYKSFTKILFCRKYCGQIKFFFFPTIMFFIFG